MIAENPSQSEPPNNDTSSLNPNALSVDDAARLLSKLCRSEITERMLNQDIEAGAPTNADGTLSLVRYAAWLLLEATDAD